MFISTYTMDIYMDIIGYILRIAPVIENIEKIDNNSINLLSLFIFNSHLSIYQVYIKMTSILKISYKVVHQKVQKLIDLGLVERITDESIISKKELEKGAKYYCLSEEGIFALFYNLDVLFNPPYYYYDQSDIAKETQKLLNILPDYKKEIFKNHKDCQFFNIFLYPWINMDTVLNLDEKTLDKIVLSLS